MVEIPPNGVNRPGFTVEDKRGRNFDANHISYSWHGGWVVSFICSGVMEILPVDEIQAIRFSKDEAYYCNECDGPVPTRMIR